MTNPLGDVPRVENLLPTDAYRALFRALPHPTWVFDPCTLQFLDVNHAAEVQYGYTRDEFLSKTLECITPPEDLPALRRALSPDREDTEFSGIWRQLARDGRIFDAEIAIESVVFHGAEAKVVIATEVTDRIELEFQRQLYAEQLHHLAIAAAEVNKGQTVNGVLNRITDKVREIVGCHLAIATLDGGSITEVVATSEKRMNFRSWKSQPTELTALRALCDGQTPRRITKSESNLHPFRDALEGHLQESPPINGWMIAPLLDSKGECFGVLQAADKFLGDFTLEDQAILVQLAYVASIAISNARLFEQTQKLRRDLETSLAQLNLIFDAAPIGIAFKDTDLRFVRVNPAMAAIHGTSAKELIGKTIREINPGLAEVVEPIQRKVLETREPVVALEIATPLPGHPETVLHGLTSLYPIVHPSGTIFGVGTIAMDVSENVRAMEALKESEERFRIVAQVTNDALWDWNLGDNYLWWSEGFFTMFGYRHDQVRAHIEGWVDRLHPEDRQRVWEGIKKKIEEHHDFWTDEYRFRRSTGEYAVVIDRGVVLRDEQGKAFRMIGGITDITVRKNSELEILRLNAELEDRVRRRTQELESANKELEAFSYSVSHDLRAPLRAIDGFARITMEDYATNIPPDMRELLELIQSNARQMAVLIDDLLAFSRLSRHAIRRELFETDLLVSQCVEALEPDLQNRSVEWAIAPMPRTWGDRSLLKQVWMNLLANAVKYSRKKEKAKIEVGVTTAAEIPGQDVFFVRDNGVGFDMRYSNKLFGVFQRLHRAEEYEGTGVGLAIVQRIVHRHGGKVWANAAPGQGATFFFTIAKETHS